ncbi:tRNA1(Val) (adenine(37)-N6)-methyltransferase [Pontivivens insulae]|uniref:Ribosomal RNA small subunit methyltransferase C n=1 Tax=Pontivivens insulae TaxID=1639689 RepID=A0A2R8A997_9RHOB|nr:methyltransferase domain-containing protein [Pontivivens insulae]RED12708.1 tRNA1(Val) A37 N6-methylase TrmN6 [Pontivivens insulae]SPF28799.1 Ribosomal RNA small subunit methyltransferase C [Pontivivens insulae]
MSQFAEDALTHDGFLGGAVTISQPRSGYRAATDPVWLAASCTAGAGEAVLELGCGAGTAMVCLAHRTRAKVTGVEVQSAYAALARRNIAANGVVGEVVEGDVGQLPPHLRARSFDHVIFNPPYFAPTSVAADDEGRDVAHREATPLAVWMDTALRRLRPKGTLTIIHRTENLDRILTELQGRAGSVQVRPLAARAGRMADRVLVRAIKTGRAPLRLLAPAVVHDGAEHLADRPDFSSLAEGILRRGEALRWEV